MYLGWKPSNTPGAGLWARINDVIAASAGAGGGREGDGASVVGFFGGDLGFGHEDQLIGQSNDVIC